MTTPPPGSDAAVARGCTCPVRDNARGHGAYGQQGNFWTAQDCPLHREKHPDA